MCYKIVLLVILSSICCSAISDMTESSFGQYKEGILAAFGDFNSDELTDAFLIINSSSIEVFLAHDKEPFLRPSQFACNFSNIVITSVVPGDYDGDAYMDILITTQIESNLTTNLHEVRIIWGGTPLLNCSDALYVKSLVTGQPLAIDYNRDMTLDLFGVNAQNERVYWVFNRNRTIPTEVRMGDGFFKKIKLPHSHSFLDVNDDNAADLLVTTTLDVEVWLSDEPFGFRYNNSIELLVGHPAIYGQALFLDVALSGEFFLVIPVCYDIQCFNSTILIYDNLQWHDLQVDFNDGKGTLWRFVPPRKEAYLDAITMRSGDFNMDGYPDILMTLSPVDNVDTKVFLLHNIPCNQPGCKFYRTFEVLWDKFDSFGNNVVMATFYDFYMDGVLDIVYVKKNTSTMKYTMHAFRNELEYDTNFIKVIVVTGLSNKRIPILNGTLYNRKVNFGTNLPGPKIGYNTWSQEGTYRTGVCAQLSQSAHYALQLPYSIFGLDRTPNFVDTLNVGLSGYSKSWTQIIPNSQIVVVPAPPDDPSQWRAQLFVTPSKVILKSVFVLTAIIIVITGFVLYLHWKERNDRQDIIEIDDKTYVKI
ncbi:T-cell immunomodulatory protein [Pectinophora gossypiella]|uniref:T-cell immunomodulatory protein TIP C2 domain-containing protein n=1 Tax=Pectinophora gossypiella TaxID=13191 RepID=A0A1E1W1I4_PECGO|nr:T-cell immunomodulatory protein [Pectinophora gossypiella]